MPNQERNLEIKISETKSNNIHPVSWINALITQVNELTHQLYPDKWIPKTAWSTTKMSEIPSNNSTHFQQWDKHYKGKTIYHPQKIKTKIKNKKTEITRPQKQNAQTTRTIYEECPTLKRKCTGYTYLKQTHGIRYVAPHPALARNPNLIFINRSFHFRLLHLLVPIHAL